MTAASKSLPTLLKGGHLVDPAQGLDAPSDCLMIDGQIAQIGNNLTHATARVVDATGCYVTPGLVDLHVHLRVPGQEHKETMTTGTLAAAAGGFTTICCMPNTVPDLDHPSRILDLQRTIEREALVRVLPIGAITTGRAGREVVDFASLAACGVIGFSDDGVSTLSSAAMRTALEFSASNNLPIMVHCEDPDLAHGGALHEGQISRELDLPGIPAAAEEIIIARDLQLAELTGGWLHVLHVSTARGLALIEEARQRGVRVTAEVMPHHLTMTDAWVAGGRTLVNTIEEPGPPVKPADPNTKVNPPLRPEPDTQALLTGLNNGQFDIIATDHAPHAESEKTGRPFTEAAPGFTALETAVPLLLALVRAGHLTISEVINRLSHQPARLLQHQAGSLAPGTPADVTVIDPDRHWQVTSATLRSKSKNTPLLGMNLRGRAVRTYVGGVECFHDC